MSRHTNITSDFIHFNERCSLWWILPAGMPRMPASIHMTIIFSLSEVVFSYCLPLEMNAATYAALIMRCGLISHSKPFSVYFTNNWKTNIFNAMKYWCKLFPLLDARELDSRHSRLLSTIKHCEHWTLTTIEL